jgi:hypothetical protein
MKKEWLDRLKFVHGLPVIYFDGLAELQYWLAKLDVPGFPDKAKDASAWIIGGTENDTVRYYLSVDFGREGEILNGHGMLVFPLTLRDQKLCERLDMLTAKLAMDNNAIRF